MHPVADFEAPTDVTVREHGLLAPARASRGIALGGQRRIQVAPPQNARRCRPFPRVVVHAADRTAVVRFDGVHGRGGAKLVLEFLACDLVVPSGEDLGDALVELESGHYEDDEKGEARGKHEHHHDRTSGDAVHEAEERHVQARLFPLGAATSGRQVAIRRHGRDDTETVELGTLAVTLQVAKALLLSLAQDHQGRKEEEGQHVNAHHRQAHEEAKLPEGLQGARKVGEEAQRGRRGRCQAAPPGMQDHPDEPLVNLFQPRALVPEVYENEDDVDVDDCDQEQRQEGRHRRLFHGREHVGHGDGRKNDAEAAYADDRAADVPPHVQRHEDNGPDRPQQITLKGPLEVVSGDVVPRVVDSDVRVILGRGLQKRVQGPLYEVDVFLRRLRSPFELLA
mmetsp:Transcript_83887/g.234123  ORF Transcript_83887/g.234123 Transcript_83887/m.234123 type:complete len:395 (+) Transcript_83887:1817-3001(+)